MNVGGDLTRAGGFTSTGTLTFDGGGAQAVNPLGSTFQDVTVNSRGASR